MQKAHPLICEARVMTSSFSKGSRPSFGIVLPSSIQGCMAAGLAVKGFSLSVIVISFFGGLPTADWQEGFAKNGLPRHDALTRPYVTWGRSFFQPSRDDGCVHPAASTGAWLCANASTPWSDIMSVSREIAGPRGRAGSLLAARGWIASRRFRTMLGRRLISCDYARLAAMRQP